MNKNPEKNQWSERALAFFLLLLTLYLLQVGVTAIAEDKNTLESVSALLFKDKEFHQERTIQTILAMLKDSSSAELTKILDHSLLFDPKTLNWLLNEVIRQKISSPNLYSDETVFQLAVAIMEHDRSEELFTNPTTSISGTIQIDNNNRVDFYLDGGIYFKISNAQIPTSMQYADNYRVGPAQVRSFFDEVGHDLSRGKVRLYQRENQSILLNSPQLARILVLLAENNLEVELGDSVRIIRYDDTVFNTSGFGDGSSRAVTYVLMDENGRLFRLESGSQEGAETVFWSKVSFDEMPIEAFSISTTEQLFNEMELLWVED